MPTGHALPLGPSFGLREPNGWMPRINSGHPIPALRPEQSDHVPWADCPQGLSSASVRFAHPPGQRLLLPILPAGLAMSRNGVRQLPPALGVRSCSPFSAVKMGGPFSLRCLSPLCPGTVGVGIYSIPAGWDVTVRPDFFARQKASGKSNPRWPFQRAMRPIAEWRSGLANKQEVVPDRRAARPSAERR